MTPDVYIRPDERLLLADLKRAQALRDQAKNAHSGHRKKRLHQFEALRLMVGVFNQVWPRRRHHKDLAPIVVLKSLRDFADEFSPARAALSRIQLSIIKEVPKLLRGALSQPLREALDLLLLLFDPRLYKGRFPIGLIVLGPWILGLSIELKKRGSRTIPSRDLDPYVRLLERAETILGDPSPKLPGKEIGLQLAIMILLRSIVERDLFRTVDEEHHGKDRRRLEQVLALQNSMAQEYPTARLQLEYWSQQWEEKLDGGPAGPELAGDFVTLASIIGRPDLAFSLFSRLTSPFFDPHVDWQGLFYEWGPEVVAERAKENPDVLHQVVLLARFVASRVAGRQIQSDFPDPIWLNAMVAHLFDGACQEQGGPTRHVLQRGAYVRWQARDIAICGLHTYQILMRLESLNVQAPRVTDSETSSPSLGQMGKSLGHWLQAYCPTADLRRQLKEARLWAQGDGTPLEPPAAQRIEAVRRMFEKGLGKALDDETIPAISLESFERCRQLSVDAWNPSILLEDSEALANDLDSGLRHGRRGSADTLKAEILEICNLVCSWISQRRIEEHFPLDHRSPPEGFQPWLEQAVRHLALKVYEIWMHSAQREFGHRIGRWLLASERSGEIYEQLIRVAQNTTDFEWADQLMREAAALAEATFGSLDMNLDQGGMTPATIRRLRFNTPAKATQSIRKG